MLLVSRLRIPCLALGHQDVVGAEGELNFKFNFLLYYDTFVTTSKQILLHY